MNEILIGVSVRYLPKKSWTYELGEDNLANQMNIIEINRNYNIIKFTDKYINIGNKCFVNKRYSMHSASNWNFSGNSIFNQCARTTFLAEIEYCKQVNNIERIIFHLNQPLNNEIIEFLTKANNIAKESKIKLVLENRSNKAPNNNADDLLNIVTKIPGIKINIDIGHLNMHVKKNIDKGIEEIKQLLPYIEHVHVHGNNGLIDQHSKLTPETIEFVKYIKNNCKNEVWWMIETLTKEDAEYNYSKLKEIFGIN